MKSVSFQQTGRVVQVKTEANVLQALLSEKVPVKMACGGRGICATCHVFVDRGQQALTPKTKSEIRTLGILGDAEPCSRLACRRSRRTRPRGVEVPSRCKPVASP